MAEEAMQQVEENEEVTEVEIPEAETEETEEEIVEELTNEKTEKQTIDPSGWYLSEKLDGMRCFWYLYMIYNIINI